VEEQRNGSEKNRYWRLAFWVLILGLLPTISEYLFNKGFHLPSLSSDQFYTDAGRLLVRTLFTGLFIGLPVWLASEHFQKPKRPRPERSLSRTPES
jgi:hypothetical protein